MRHARAHEHQGYHSFTVRVATFANGQAAQHAADQLRGAGVTPQLSTDKVGHTIVATGPVGTYSQAESMKVRFSAQFPDAIIIP